MSGLDVFFSYGARSDIYQTRVFPDRTALPQQDPLSIPSICDNKRDDSKSSLPNQPLACKPTSDLPRPFLFLEILQVLHPLPRPLRLLHILEFARTPHSSVTVLLLRLPASFWLHGRRKTMTLLLFSRFLTLRMMRLRFTSP